MLKVTKLTVLGLLLAFLIPTAAFALKDDIKQMRRIADAAGLNEDGRRYVHDIMQGLKDAKGKVDLDEIVDLCNEAAQHRKFLKTGGKCMKRGARAVKSLGRKAGPFGVFLAVLFIADDVRADGICVGVARNVPGIDVVVDGNETISDIAEIVNEWNLSDANNQVNLSHMLAGYIISQFDGWSGDPDSDPEKVYTCYSQFYDYLQAAIHIRIANQPDPDNINWDFIYPNHPNFPNWEFNQFYACIAKAKRPLPPPVCCCQDSCGS